MKKLIVLLLLFTCLNVISQSDVTNGRLVPYKFSNNLNFNVYDVSKKVFVTNKLELKTYETSINTFEINTDKNEFVTLFFSNDIAANINTNSEFRVDMFHMVLKETNTFPHKITVESYNMNLALMDGDGYFISSKGTNDQIFLQTPLSNFGLDNGKYWIQSNKKFVLIFILSGTLDIYDNVTNKKETIQSENAVLIRPIEGVVGKQAELFIDKVVTSVKKVKLEQIKDMISDVNKISQLKDEIIWVNFNGQILAVKVK